MFINPEYTINQLGLREGMKVADFGAGSGAYTKLASAKVGSTGIVYAIEVQKDLVTRLESEVKKWGFSNVECLWADIEKKGGTKLADKSIDYVIISNVLFQAEDKLGLIDEAKRILKDDGRVLLIDWSDSYSGMGPAPHHLVTEEAARALFKQRGFRVMENISTSVHHYGIIFIHSHE